MRRSTQLGRQRMALSFGKKYMSSRGKQACRSFPPSFFRGFRRRQGKTCIYAFFFLSIASAGAFVLSLRITYPKAAKFIFIFALL